MTLMTKEQVEKLYEHFKEYPSLIQVRLVDKENGSGIGPNTDAVFYSGGPLVYTEEKTIDVTDVGTW
jgi:hypothetical protein